MLKAWHVIRYLVRRIRGQGLRRQLSYTHTATHHTLRSGPYFSPAKHREKDRPGTEGVVMMMMISRPCGSCGFTADNRRIEDDFRKRGRERGRSNGHADGSSVVDCRGHWSLEPAYDTERKYKMERTCARSSMRASEVDIESLRGAAGLLSTREGSTRVEKS
jgi:hypothetical protein